MCCYTNVTLADQGEFYVTKSTDCGGTLDLGIYEIKAFFLLLKFKMSIQDVLDRLLKMEGKLDNHTEELQSITTVVADISKQNSENLTAMDEMEERMMNNMDEMNQKVKDVHTANTEIV